MTEVFDALSVVGDPVPEEDRVVHLLASLPESYSMLVTALEANAEVPKMELVTERLLHEERKLKDREGADVSSGDDCGSMYSVPLLFLPSALDANECTRMHSCSLMVQVQFSALGQLCTPFLPPIALICI